MSLVPSHFSIEHVSTSCGSVMSLRSVASTLTELVESASSINEDLSGLLDAISAQTELLCTTLDEVQREAALEPPLPVLKRGDKPKAPRDMLSLSDLRSVYTSLDLIWAWGVAKTIYPYLSGRVPAVDKLHPKVTPPSHIPPPYIHLDVLDVLWPNPVPVPAPVPVHVPVPVPDPVHVPVPVPSH